MSQLPSEPRYAPIFVLLIMLYSLVSLLCQQWQWWWGIVMWKCEDNNHAINITTTAMSHANKQHLGSVKQDTVFLLQAVTTTSCQNWSHRLSFLSKQVIQICLEPFMICGICCMPWKAHWDALHEIQDMPNPIALMHVKQDEALQW